MLEIAKYELDNLWIPDPRILPRLDQNVFAATDWDVLNPSQGLRTIDDAVFDVLELTSGEVDAVYEGVMELVENRRTRAKSV